MSEEVKIQPENTETAPEAVTEEIPQGEAAQTEVSAAPAKRKGDPWKTAFIVLVGISVISAVVFFTTYGRRTDLPTAPIASADANALPVQMANPPTGAPEQAALRQQLPEIVGNSVDMGAMPGGPDPWANPGRFQSNSTDPYQVVPVSPPGQQVYMETNPSSPFMSDGQPLPMPSPNANSAGGNTGRTTSADANKAKPTTSPTPGTAAPAGNTTAPVTQPKPGATPPAVKPKPIKKNSGKPSGTSTGKKTGSDTEQDT